MGRAPEVRKGPLCEGTNLGKVEEREDKEISENETSSKRNYRDWWGSGHTGRIWRPKIQTWEHCKIRASDLNVFVCSLNAGSQRGVGGRGG